MRRPKAGAVQRCSQGDPTFSVNTIDLLHLEWFFDGQRAPRMKRLQLRHADVLNDTIRAGRSHVFSSACSYRCASKHVSSSFFLYGNFAHPNVKQQLFGQHFEKQLVILAALILKLGFPLHTEKKKLLFLLQ